MELIIRVLLCLCLLTLISCGVSLSPQAQLKNLNSLPTIEKTVGKTVKGNLIFSQGDWPKQKWWTLYHSIELNQLIGDALANNPSIQEINSRVIVAKQEALVTGSVLFPLVFFDATENRQYLSKNGLYRALNPKLPLSVNLVDLSLSFQYEFDFWGQNRNLLRAAIGEEKAQQAEAAEVELLITTAVAQSYFAYKTNLIRQQLYQQLVFVRKNLSDLQNLLLRKGLSSKLPSYTASENLLTAQKLLSSIKAEIKVNKHLINILAGRAPNSPLAITPSVASLPTKLIIPKTLSLDLIAPRV